MSTDMTLLINFLEYDEEIDAVCALELLAEHLPKVITVPYHWKWVILALQNALQGFMVLSLQGTNALNVLTKDSAKDWMEHYETGQFPSKPQKLDFFLELYAKIKSDAMKIRTDSKFFVPNGTQDKNVQALNSFRREFAHYVPAVSLSNMEDWAGVILDVIPIIEFLAFESHNIVFHREGSRERVAGLCLIAKEEASALLKYYGT